MGRPWSSDRIKKSRRSSAYSFMGYSIVLQAIGGELLPLAEFVIWNTPGKFGLSPRDLVMSWSLASPLARELLPFELPRREAVSDVAAAQFEQFRNLRQRQLALRARDGRRRAELANRSRSPRRPEVGDRVLYNDRDMRPASEACGGRFGSPR